MSAIKRVLEDATSTSLIMMSKKAFDSLRQSTEGKELAANYAGAIVMTNSVLAVPTPDKFKQAFKDETGCDIIVVDRTVFREKTDGSRVKTRPFNDNKVVFLSSTQVGALVYGNCVEQGKPVTGVMYTNPVPYALLSRYAENNPYKEFTAIKGICAPIIEGVDQI